MPWRPFFFDRAMASSDLPLDELTRESARMGSFLLAVSHVQTLSYEYMWNGQMKQGKKLVVTFVSPSPRLYCLGSAKMQKGNETELKKLEEQFQIASTWRFFELLFADDKPQYIAAPIKLVLDLRRSKKVRVLDAKDFKQHVPEPATTIAEVVGLHTAARIDVIGLCSEMSEPRHQVVDGSSAISDSDKKAELCLSAFFVATSTSVEPSELTQLRSAIAGKKPLALMGLNVKLGDNRSLEVTTARDFYCFVAQGAKAEEMAPTCESKDYLSEPAHQSTVALIDTLLNAGAISDPKLVQVNFVTITRPAKEQKVLTNDGDRLWIIAKMADCTGAITLALRERAVLSLANVPDKEQFLDLLKEDGIQFPLMSSARIVLKDAQGIIVEAEEQSFTLQPTMAMSELSSYVQSITRRADATLPSTLKALTASAHYRVLVASGEVMQPCERALVLLKSTKRTHQTPLGDGFRLTTPGVQCGLEETEMATYEAVGTATNATLKDFVLDPPKTGERVMHALGLVVGVDVKTGKLLLEQIQPVRPEDVTHARDLLSRLIAWSATWAIESRKHSSGGGTKRAASEVPSATRTCRRLSACPTDAPFPY
ncbi:unnamed protein product [Effrenium voratum]|uniref:Uncharacterized protein n=2 Tax=Effrenium voratum TaxID=2562239 RepID=A0AA36N2P7_9DINO|nr:unnamed protein product [Effrenium voratum]